MEDRYLFKAKTCNGEWVAGFLHCKENKWYISNKAGAPFAFEVRPDTICQCTGLKDKNGKLIWENDICKYYNPEDKDGVGIIKDDYVSWIKGIIATKELMTPLFYLRCSDKWKVIGNIFDNPELLESEEN